MACLQKKAGKQKIKNMTKKEKLKFLKFLLQFLIKIRESKDIRIIVPEYDLLYDVHSFLSEKEYFEIWDKEDCKTIDKKIMETLLLIEIIKNK